MIVSTTPEAWTELSFGNTYQVSANVTDVGTGVAQVSFDVDGQTFTVPRSASVAGIFTSPAIAVSANSVNTNVPVTVTATDYAGVTATQTFNLIYLAVDDPTVPTGEWLCPISGATLPAYVGAYPATVSELLGEVERALGVDVAGIMSGRARSGNGEGAPRLPAPAGAPGGASW